MRCVVEEFADGAVAEGALEVEDFLWGDRVSAAYLLDHIGVRGHVFARLAGGCLVLRCCRWSVGVLVRWLFHKCSLGKVFYGCARPRSSRRARRAGSWAANHGSWASRRCAWAK